MVRLLAILLTLLFAAPPAADYDALRKQAEASYAEKSFARAHELYAQALTLALSPEERRWIEFRLADTSWRQVQNSPHTSERAALDELIRQSGETHDRVWAEAEESIGDMIASGYDGGSAIPFYSSALEWWAGSSDADARQRYLRIVFAMAAANRWGSMNLAAMPIDALVDALTIAQSQEERAHLRYLLALRLTPSGVVVARERALDLLEQNIALGKTTGWYGRSLMAAAHLLTEGETPDFVKALEYYERVANGVPRSEYAAEYGEAETQIGEITRPLVSVSCMATFLPGAAQEVQLNWRNVKSIALTLRRVDLASVDVHRDGEPIRDDAAPVVRRWRENVPGEIPYAPGQKTLDMKPQLTIGAYVLTAEAEGKRSDALIVVSDANIVTHSLAGRSDIYVSDALHGAPIADARVRVWHWERKGNDTVAVSQRLRTDANGIAHADIERSSGQILIMASAGARQALFRSYVYGSYGDEAQWRFYAFTDRPAYRPGETVHWKMIARERDHAGDEWQTPAKRTVEYAINGPRGKVASGVATFNDFGSFWADLPVTASMPLGSYAIALRGDADRTLGYAQLFTLEEYKLPEFTISLDTPTPYRLGDTVETAIDARYYFGAPVTSAAVDVHVTRAPLFPAEPWQWRQSGTNREVLHRTVRTDANGRALVRFDTSVDTDNSSYVVSACATDSSRRQVCTSGSIVVLMQRYRVAANAKHRVAAPGDPIAVDFKATDAKEKPVEASGTVTVTRKTWDAAERRYRETRVSTARVATDAAGAARFTFRPDRDGYYFVSWSSVDAAAGAPKRARDVVTAQTAVWVTSKSSVSYGYHTAGLELIVDREGLRAGGRAPVLIATPAAGRWVLLTTSGDRIIDTQLIHLDGSVKVIDIPLDRRHVPDFQIAASSVFDDAMSSTTEQLDVADDRAITVDVKADRETYKPRERGSVTIATRDAAGKPVAAEVSLAVLDESVTAIAKEDAIDPQSYFYPKRGPLLRIVGELQYAPFKQRKDERQAEEPEPQEADEVDDGVAGGALAARVSGVPKPVAESVTVTAEAPLLDTNHMQQAQIIVRHDFR